jgi:hypothetical protein
MAIEKIIDLQIQSNADQAEKSVGTLKQQLKAAKAEVLALSDQFGLTSQQAIHAAERAAELGHEISAANKLVKTFNPSTTLNSTTQALGSVKEGFEVASHSMKSFGVESTQLEGALGKVSLAMEFSSGITQIQESQESFKRLGATLKSYSIVQKAITAGQWLWNAALMANPIGAIVVAITALIAAGYALTKYFMANAEASHKNEEAIKQNSKALNEQIKTANKNTEAFDINSKQKLAMAKASGKSAEEIRKLELKLADEKIAFEKSSREIAQNTFYKNQNALATLKAAGADEEQIKNQEEVTKKSLEEFGKQTKNLNDSVKEKAAIINRQQVEIRTSETKNNEDLKNKRYENNKQELQDTLSNTELSFNQKRNLINKNSLLEIDDKNDFLREIDKQEKAFIKKTQEEKLEQERAFAKTLRETQMAESFKAQDDIIAAQKANADMLLTEQQLAIKNEEEAYRIKKENAIKAGYDEKTGLQELETEHWNKINDINLTAQEKQKATDKANSDAKIKLTELEKKAKLDAADAVANTLSAMSDLLGKETAAGKAAAIASATINTFSSAQKAYDATVGIPYVGPILAPINAGIAIAAGIKNVKSILAVKVPGGGGGGSAPSGGAAAQAGVTAPSFNVVGASGTNQLAQSIGAQQQQPIRTYVVSNDVTTAQSLQRNIIESATIGG